MLAADEGAAFEPDPPLQNAVAFLSATSLNTSPFLLAHKTMQQRLPSATCLVQQDGATRGCCYGKENNDCTKKTR